MRYLGSQGDLALSTNHDTMTNYAIEFDTRTPESATRAARTLRALGCEHLRRADKIIRKRKNTTDYTRLPWDGNTVQCASHLPSSLSHFRPSIKTEGVDVWEPLCQPELFGVNAALMAGFIIRLVTIQSNDPEVISLSWEAFKKLRIRYAGPLPDEAIRGCDTRLPPSIYQTTIPQLKAWAAASSGVDFMAAPIPQDETYTDYPLKKLKDQRITLFVSLLSKFQ